MTTDRRGLAVAGSVLVVHLLVSLGHGVPHAAIPVPLTPAQQAFVWVVIVLGPVAGFALAWYGRVTVGAALYAATMLGAFVFGVYHHFLVANPDNVAAVPAGLWHGPFVWTAVLVTISEAAGVVVGVWLWSAAREGRERVDGRPSSRSR